MSFGMQSGRLWLLALCALTGLLPVFDAVAATHTPPTITSQPQSLAVVTGAGASFSVTASGTLPLYYQWQKNGATISGATGTAYSLSSVTTNDAASYTVVVNNAYGTVTSSAATLTVYVPPWFTLQPTNLVVTNGNDAVFTASAQGIPAPAFQWFFGTSALGGQTSATLSLPRVQTNQAGGYYCVASNVAGTATSTVATLTVRAVPVITAQPQSRINLAGTTATFTAVASGAAPLTYQWQFNGFSLVNDGRISGATSSSLAIASVQPADAGSYTLVASNSLGTATSAAATLAVVLPGDCVPAADALVGWWPGDGNASDVAGGNNGVLQGGATANAPGMVGSAFSFDGTNGYVQIADSPVLRPTNLTVEAWVLFSSLDSAGLGGTPPGEQYIVFKQNSRSSPFEGYNLLKLRGTDGDVLAFVVSSALGQIVELRSTSLVATGVWYHVAGVRGSNFVQIYVNGKLENQASVSFAQDYGNFPLYFGTSGQTYWDRKFKGQLDEVSLYNRALSSTEVAAVYEVGIAGKCKAPVITVEPQSQAATAGTNVLFTVTAKGFGSLSYQWRFNGASIAGATGANLILTNAQPTNAGSYLVVVTNSLGSATSAVATLTVWAPPVISAQPQSRTNTLGTDASFSVTASGTPPPAYQWQFNSAAIPGATGSTLVRSAVSFSNAGGYRVVVTNLGGAVTSAVATLTVVCPSVTVSPATLPSVLVGSAYSQNLTASGGSAPYTFVVTAGILPSGLSLSGAGLLNGTPSAIGTNSFTVSATDANGCWGTNGYTLAVTGAPPVIAVQPQSRTNLIGTDASFSVTASGTPPPAYQWQFNGVAIPGATASDLVRSAVSFADGGSYRVVLSNAAGVATSTVATLTIVCPSVTLGPTSLPGGAPGSTYSQTLSASGGSGPYTFTVTAGSLPAGLSLSGAGVLSGVPSAVGTNSFTVTATDTNGCSGSQPYSLAVTGSLTITAEPVSLVVMAGENAGFAVTASGVQPLSYRWRFNGINLSDGGQVSGATTANLSLTGVRSTNAGSYTVVVTNVVGSVTSTVATLTVVPAPACASPGAGLVGWWPGDGNADDIAGSNDGILEAGATAGATGLVGSALHFDGTNAYVLIPDAPDLRPTNLTLELWVRFNSLDTPTVGNSPVGEQFLVFKEGVDLTYWAGFALTKTRGARGDVFTFEVDSTQGQVAELNSQTLVQTGVWYHVACVRGANFLQLYVNGQLEGQTNVGFPQSYGDYPLYFGTTAQPAWDHKFAGTLDEVSLYNRALSSNEVAAIYAAGSDGKCWGVTITSQPQSRAAALGSNVSLSVTASGAPPLMYQWQRDGVNLTNGGNVLGASSSTLTLANVSLADSANYRVIVANSVGAVTSAVAVLEVVTSLIPPSITTQPVSQSVPTATNVTFTVGVAGTAPFGYQWRFNGTDLANNGQFSGATAPTLTLTYTVPANSGAYSVVVTNDVGAITSAVATLTVSPPAGCLSPPPGLVGWWPGDGTARDIVGTNNGTLMGGATATAPAMVGTGFSMDGTNMYVQIPDAPELKPDELTVECWAKWNNLNAPGTSIYVGQQYLVFKQNSRSGDFEGYVLSKDRTWNDIILWEVTSAAGHLVRIDSISPVTTNVWYHLAGVRGSNYIQLYFNGVLEAQTNVDFPQDYGDWPLYFGTSGQSYWDRRLNGVIDEVSLYNRALSAGEIAALYASGAAGKCKGTNGVIITAQPNSQLAAVGTNVSFSVTATGLAPLTYQWQFNGVVLSGATSTNLTLFNVQLTNAGSYRVVVSNPAGSALSDPAVLTVGLSPSVTLQPTNETVPPGGTATFTALATGSLPLEYHWQFNGSELPGASAETLVLSNVQPAQAGSYSVLVTNNAGAATSPSAMLIVTGPPSLLNARTTAQGMFAFTLSGPAGTTYVVEVTTNLHQWAPLAVLTNATGLADFTDTTSSNSLSRFYRARLAD